MHTLDVLTCKCTGIGLSAHSGSSSEGKSSLTKLSEHGLVSGFVSLVACGACRLREQCIYGTRGFVTGAADVPKLPDACKLEFRTVFLSVYDGCMRGITAIGKLATHSRIEILFCMPSWQIPAQRGVRRGRSSCASATRLSIDCTHVNVAHLTISEQSSAIFVQPNESIKKL